MKEKIICAAIWFDDGIAHVHQPDNITTGFIICGRRHHNCFNTLAILKGRSARLKYKERVQGFLTTKNRFLTRDKAALVAINAGQVINLGENAKWGEADLKTVQLYSEDIY